MNPVDTSLLKKSFYHSINEINSDQGFPRTPVKQVIPSDMEKYLYEKELELMSHKMNFISIYDLHHDSLVLALENKSPDSVEYIVEVEEFRQKKGQHSNLMDQKDKCYQAKNEQKEINQTYDLDSISRNLNFSL